MPSSPLVCSFSNCLPIRVCVPTVVAILVRVTDTNLHLIDPATTLNFSLDFWRLYPTFLRLSQEIENTIATEVSTDVFHESDRASPLIIESDCRHIVGTRTNAPSSIFLRLGTSHGARMRQFIVLGEREFPLKEKSSFHLFLKVFGCGLKLCRNPRTLRFDLSNTFS